MAVFQRHYGGASTASSDACLSRYYSDGGRVNASSIVTSYLAAQHFVIARDMREYDDVGSDDAALNNPNDRILSTDGSRIPQNLLFKADL